LLILRDRYLASKNLTFLERHAETHDVNITAGKKSSFIFILPIPKKERIRFIHPSTASFHFIPFLGKKLSLIFT